MLTKINFTTKNILIQHYSIK